MPLSVTVSWVTSAGAEQAIDLRVRRLTLDEALSELFELHLRALSTDSALAPEDFLGRMVCVRIRASRPPPRS